MEISQSDKILVTIKQVNRGSILGSTKHWDNISRIVVSCSNSNSEIVPSQALPAQVDRIDGDTAYVSVTRAPYVKHVWPGDTIEATPTYFSKNGIAVAEQSSTTFDTVYVIGAVPEETVEVKILQISERVAIGIAIESRSLGLEVGDKLKVSVEGDSSIGRTDEGTFKVHLPTQAYVNTEIVVEIVGLDGKVDVEIIDSGALPIHGNELTASVERGSTLAYVPTGDYEVSLSKPALATGDVQIEANQPREGEQPTASIISYEGLIPDVGDIVTVWSSKDNAQAKPKNGTYRVHLPAEIPVHTCFSVEITNINECIEGDLADLGGLPVSGNLVEAKVEEGSTTAVAELGQYEIRLKDPALANGTTSVEIISSPAGGLPEGYVVSYDDLLPSIGERVIVQSRPGQSVAESKDETYTIRLDEFIPIRTNIEVEITGIDQDGVHGNIVDRGELPEDGERVSACSKSGQTIAESEDGKYTVQLNESTPIRTNIEVEITGIDQEGVHGNIVDQGEIPEEGDAVKATVLFKQARGKVKEGYVIRLDGESIASGTATINVDQVSDKTVRGSVAEYHCLPEVGGTVRAKIFEQEQIAIPTSGRYEIHLEESPQTNDKAVVKITSIDDVVRGTVVRKDSKSLSKDNPFNQTSSKNDLISGEKL